MAINTRTGSGLKSAKHGARSTRVATLKLFRMEHLLTFRNKKGSPPAKKRKTCRETGRGRSVRAKRMRRATLKIPVGIVGKIRSSVVVDTHQTMIRKILLIAGPTASGKSARGVAEALARNGEIISVDSRQVYRGLDIGTEKITSSERRGVPHHLIDIRDPKESYSAGDFVADARRLIEEISARGKLPILVGGTHFYLDALFKGLPPPTPSNAPLRRSLEKIDTEGLYARVLQQDPKRAARLDPRNRRRLIRALEIIESFGAVPPRSKEVRPPYSVKRSNLFTVKYDVEWIIMDPPREELRARIDARLVSALANGLVEEVRRVREAVGDTRLNELGLEYKIVGEYLRAGGTERSEVLLPTLSAKLWQYARRQKAWLRKLYDENIISVATSRQGRN